MNADETRMNADETRIGLEWNMDASEGCSWELQIAQINADASETCVERIDQSIFLIEVAQAAPVPLSGDPAPHHIGVA